MPKLKILKIKSSRVKKEFKEELDFKNGNRAD
jgi:hypothetical protein